MDKQQEAERSEQPPPYYQTGPANPNYVGPQMPNPPPVTVIHGGAPVGQQVHFVPTYVAISTSPQVPIPTPMTCPHCKQSIITKVDYESGILTWLGVGMCALFGCILGCCLIPFCVDGCKDVIHTCPSCGKYIGTYRRLG